MNTNWAAIARATASAGVIIVTAIALVPMALLTAFSARRLYAAVATLAARLILRIWRISLVVERSGPWPAGQTVYVSNHSSTIDLFALVALGLPRTRFFLSGFLRKAVPLGFIAHLMGTFFTVPQTRPAERTRIFQRAARILSRSGESVYLSPEGGRVVGGHIGRFNRGAFHLAASLGAPIVPLHFVIPASMDPGRGYVPGAGTIRVRVKPPIATRAWQIEDIDRHRDEVRDLFVAWHRQAREEATPDERAADAGSAVPLGAR